VYIAVDNSQRGSGWKTINAKATSIAEGKYCTSRRAGQSQAKLYENWVLLTNT
jgi:hypothetical protein